MLSKKLKIFLFALIIIIIISFLIRLFDNKNGGDLGDKSDKNNLQKNSLNIVTSSVPLYSLTRIVVGDQGKVIPLIPNGVDLHDYEPTPKDWIAVNHSDAFVTLGTEFEEYERKIINNLDAGVKIILVAKNIFSSPNQDGFEDGSPKVLTASAVLKNNSFAKKKNPHFWSSPQRVHKIVENIIAGLIDLDPDRQKFYQENGKSLLKNLQNLDQKYKQELSSCKQKKFLIHHNSHPYLAQDYGLESLVVYNSIFSIEPSSKQMVAVIKKAQAYQIKYIFIDPITDSKMIRTITKELSVRSLPLYNLESWQDSSKSYLSLLEENLNNLKIGLEC